MAPESNPLNNIYPTHPPCPRTPTKSTEPNNNPATPQPHTDLADIYAYNKSAEMVGKAFALQPGLREKFQIVYKVIWGLGSDCWVGSS